jgi:hypothetical protein
MTLYPTKPTMKSTGCFSIGIRCGFYGFKITYMNLFSIYSYPRLIRYIISTFIQSHSFMTRCVGFSFWSVPVILCMGCLTEIFYPVVKFIEIYMVNLFHWPFSVYIEPRQTVSQIPSTKDAYFPVFIRSAGRSANISFVPSASRFCAFLPSKGAGIRIVIKNRLNKTLRDTYFGIIGFFSHGGLSPLLVRAVAQLQLPSARLLYSTPLGSAR